MDPARPLRDVFADLVGDESARQAHAADPEGFLHAAGHPELPGSLVSEAIVNYADTAPAEVAEHLAPFVMAHSPVPVEDDLPVDELDATHGLDLLATAAAGAVPDDDLALDVTGHDLADHDVTGHEIAGDLADPFGLDFGHGDSGEPAHHLDLADPGTDGTDQVAAAGRDRLDTGPDWLGDSDHPDPAAHLDSPADLDQMDDRPDHLDQPDHPPDAAGSDEHAPDDVADL